MFFTTLPKDIKYEIAVHLSLDNLYNLVCCNKSLAGISRDDEFWRRKLTRDFPEEYQNKPQKQTFKGWYLKFGLINELWFMTDRQKRLLAKGVLKIVSSGNDLYWIDRYHNLWHYTLSPKCLCHPLVSQGTDTTKDEYGGLQGRRKTKLLSNIKNVCPALNWVIDLNDNLYVYDYYNHQLKVRSVRNIGCSDEFCYYVLTNKDLYVCVQDNDDIFVKQNVEKVVASPDGPIYYLTSDGSLWKWHNDDSILISLGSLQVTPGWTNKQLIQYGVKDLAWCHELVLLDVQDELYVFDEETNRRDRITYQNVKRVYSGSFVRFTDSKDILWQKSLIDFREVDRDVEDCCELDSGELAYVKRISRG